MKNKWYGDRKDLMKWTAILHLARATDTRLVLQVAYLRPEDAPDHIVFAEDSRPIPISDQVINHFRNISNIEQLSTEPRIEVLDLPFRDRDLYEQHILDKIIEGEHPCIVFLDPDTGLAPQKSRAGFEHVLASELKNIWTKMTIGDMLVLYQHQTNRSGQPWIKQKCGQFEEALGLPPSSAKYVYSPEVKDAVILYYSKVPS